MSREIMVIKNMVIFMPWDSYPLKKHTQKQKHKSKELDTKPKCSNERVKKGT